MSSDKIVDLHESVFGGDFKNSEGEDVLDLNQYSIEELKEILKEKEEDLSDLEKELSTKKYLVDGGLDFIEKLIVFIYKDVQITWKGMQAAGLAKLLQQSEDIKKDLTRGNITECMVDYHMLYMINLFIMNTTTIGYPAAARVQRIHECVQGACLRYNEDAAVINKHREVVNSIIHHINMAELEENDPIPE